MPSLEDQHAALGRFAYLVAGDLDLARDLTQEAFLQAAGRGLDLKAPGSLPYLRAIVVNLWRRRFRRLAAEARALVRVGSVPPAAGEDAVDDRDLVWRAPESSPRGSGCAWFSATTRIFPWRTSPGSWAGRREL